jgi:hypothetical protein
MAAAVAVRYIKKENMKRTMAATLLKIGIALAGIGLVPESHAQYGRHRVGAICADGTQSSAQPPHIQV